MGRGGAESIRKDGVSQISGGWGGGGVGGESVKVTGAGGWGKVPCGGVGMSLMYEEFKMLQLGGLR